MKILNILVRDKVGPTTWQWQFLLCQRFKLSIPKTVSDEILQKKKRIRKNVDELKDLVELIERK